MRRGRVGARAAHRGKPRRRQDRAQGQVRKRRRGWAGRAPLSRRSHRRRARLGGDGGVGRRRVRDSLRGQGGWAVRTARVERVQARRRRGVSVRRRRPPRSGVRVVVRGAARRDDARRGRTGGRRRRRRRDALGSNAGEGQVRERHRVETVADARRRGFRPPGRRVQGTAGGYRRGYRWGCPTIVRHGGVGPRRLLRRSSQGGRVRGVVHRRRPGGRGMAAGHPGGAQHRRRGRFGVARGG
mmetsp:Transcript_2611/g.10590  ORF Transcript_2611/g.10590 Transcript_2611/m.10590 type:complete len:241 (-) Transcript_2611:685-1407(-)